MGLLIPDFSEILSSPYFYVQNYWTLLFNCQTIKFQINESLFSSANIDYKFKKKLKVNLKRNRKTLIISFFKIPNIKAEKMMPLGLMELT